MTARRDFTIALGITTCVSLAGNVAAATLLPHSLELPTPVVIAAASVAPLLLPGAVHLVPKTSGLPVAARRVVVLAVLVAGIAAFALSFASLAAVAQASGHVGYLGMLLPIAVDVLAAAAALALVLLPDEPGDADQAADHDAPQLDLEAVDRSASPAAAGARDAVRDSDQVATPDRVMARHSVDDAPASQPVTSGDAVTRTSPPRRLASVPAAPSDRDAEILRRVAAGESSATIASALGMSKSTALRNIRRVTEADSAASTVATA